MMNALERAMNAAIDADTKRILNNQPGTFHVDRSEVDKIAQTLPACQRSKRCFQPNLIPY